MTLTVIARIMMEFNTGTTLSRDKNKKIKEIDVESQNLLGWSLIHRQYSMYYTVY